MSLIQDQNLLQTMVGYSPDLICALTAGGHFRHVSDACRWSLGYENSEIIGKHFSDILHPDDSRTALEKFWEAFSQAEPVGFESRCLGKDGQQVNIVWSALRAATDELLICVGRIVTQQQQRTQQAREHVAQHRAIIEHGFDMVGITDENGIYSYVGGATYRMLGYLPENLVGRSCFDFVHPDDLAGLLSGWSLLGSLPTVTTPDFRFRAADGSWRWVETIVTGYQATSSRSYLLSSRDITERKHSSMAQAESEHRFRLLFNNDAALAVFQTIDGLILDANPALLRFLRKEKQQVLLRPLVDFLPRQVRALFIAEHRKAVRGQKVQFETRVTIADSEERTLRVTKTPLVVSDTIVGVYGSVCDITEIATAQHLIKRQAEQFNTLLESINDAFLSLDKDWNLTYLNRQAEELLGISKQSALGVSVWTLLSEDASGIFHQKYQQAIDTRQTVRFEAYFQRERRWLEVKAYPFAEGLSVLLADITKRVEDEKQLKLLALVARNTDNSVIITDAEGRTEWVNDAFMKTTGYGLAELVGRTPGSVLQGPDTDPATVQHIREQLQLQTAFSTIILNYHKSGKKLWLSLDITPIYSEAGELTQYVSIQQNITFRKEAEVSQAAMTQDLCRQNRDLQQLTYVISHNLRAPLANALGLATLLKRVDKTSPVFDTALTSLRQSMVQTDNVLKDLNLVLSIRDKKGVVALEPLALKDICQQALQDLAEPLQQCDGHVSLEIEDGLLAHGTRAYLYSIFYNLLSNSIKYRSPERPLRVGVTCAWGAHGGPIIHLTDNGSGFDRAQAGPDVFQLYKRFHTTPRGRGIGLFLVKTHVEDMGGKIEVTSEVNVGTHFSIHLYNH